jgi:hypothetical protein
MHLTLGRREQPSAQQESPKGPPAVLLSTAGHHTDGAFATAVALAPEHWLSASTLSAEGGAASIILKTTVIGLRCRGIAIGLPLYRRYPGTMRARSSTAGCSIPALYRMLSLELQSATKPGRNGCPIVRKEKTRAAFAGMTMSLGQVSFAAGREALCSPLLA